MQSEVNYKYASCDNIDLDSDSLYEYVMELEDIQKSIQDTPPLRPESFGKLEGFNNLSKKNKSSKILYLLCVVLLVLFIYMFLCELCKPANTFTPSYGYKFTY